MLIALGPQGDAQLIDGETSSELSACLDKTTLSKRKPFKICLLALVVSPIVFLPVALRILYSASPSYPEVTQNEQHHNEGINSHDRLLRLLSRRRFSMGRYVTETQNSPSLTSFSPHIAQRIADGSSLTHSPPHHQASDTSPSPTWPPTSSLTPPPPTSKPSCATTPPTTWPT